MRYFNFASTALIMAWLFCFSDAARLGWQNSDVKEPVNVHASHESKFSQAIFQGLAMTLVSEMGDETFIIAAILAMKHPRIVIFTGALTALALMTAISAFMGVVIPSLISPELTNKIATVLYFCFGIRLLYIAYKSSSDDTEEEIKEVEEKLAERKTPTALWKRTLLKFCTPVLLEACILTFMAEWGDRSQIATITLASHLDPIGVTIGAIAGHSVCTGLAVIGGQLVAMKISQKTAGLCGSVLFFLFALHNLLWG